MKNKSNEKKEEDVMLNEETFRRKHPYKLIAKTSFGKYKKGHLITDFDEVTNILNSAEKSLVTKILN